MEGLQEVIEKIKELLEGLKKGHEEEARWLAPCYNLCCFCCRRWGQKPNPENPGIMYFSCTDEEEAPTMFHCPSSTITTLDANIAKTFTTGGTK